MAESNSLKTLILKEEADLKRLQKEWYILRKRTDIISNIKRHRLEHMLMRMS